jgi:hypothetical protein
MWREAGRSLGVTSMNNRRLEAYYSAMIARRQRYIWFADKDGSDRIGIEIEAEYDYEDDAEEEAAAEVTPAVTRKFRIRD